MLPIADCFPINFQGVLAFGLFVPTLPEAELIDAETKAGMSFAADLASILSDQILIFPAEMERWLLGLNISNIGTKISYTESQEESFIPINLRLGGQVNYRSR
jgi:hypothetical protein